MASKTKRKSLKRHLSFFVAVLLSVVIAVIVLTQSRFFPYQLTKYINGQLLDDPRFEFSCQKISGDLFKNFVVHNPVLRYHSSEASFNVFRADEIAVSYSLLDVLKLNLVVDDLQLRNVRLQIRKDQAGLLTLPGPPAREPGEKPSGFSPRADVRNFEIDGLQVYFGGGGRELAVRDVNLRGAFRYAQGSGRLEIDRGDAFVTGSETPVQAIQLDVTADANGVKVDNFTARVGRSFVTANGGYNKGRLRRVQVIFNPIVLSEVHELGLIPEMEGEFGGNVILNGALASLSIEASVAGAGLGIATSGLSFKASVDGERLTLTQMRGDVFGARFDGSFYYDVTGGGDYGFEGECANLDLTQGFLPGRGLPDTDLYGRVRLDFKGLGRTYEIEAELDSARVDDYRAGEVSMVARWTDDLGFQMDDFRLSRPGYAVEGSGRIDPAGKTEVVFRTAGHDLSYFWDYASLPRVSGSVAVGGRFAGPIDSLQVNLNGRLYGARYKFAEIDTGVVQAEIRGVGSKHVSASVDVAGNSMFLGGRAYQNPHLFLESSHGVTVVRDFSFARGDTFFTTDFEVTADGETSSIGIKHVAVTTPSQEWRTRAPSELVLNAGGGVQLDSLVFVSSSGVLGVSGAYSKENNTCDVRSWGEDVDLGLLRDTFSLPVRLEGRGRFRIRVDGRLENPAVAVNLGIENGTVDSLEFDHLQIVGGFDGTRYTLSGLSVFAGGDSILATGRGDFGTSPIVLLTGDWERESLSDQPFRVDVDSRHFPIPAILSAFHVPSYIGGAYTGSAVIENTLENPRIRIDGRITPRQGRGHALPSTSLDVTYDENRLEITEIAVTEDFGARLTGDVPVSFDFFDGLRLDRESQVNLDFAIGSGNLSALEPYIGAVSLLTGEVNGTVSVGGTFNEPVFRGRLDVKRGEVRFAAVDETYADIAVTINFVDNVVHVASINGKSRGHQALFGSGSIELSGFKPAHYRLDFLLRDCWITQTPEIEALLNGNLTVTSFETSDNRTIPNITGALVLTEASLRYSFETAGRRPSTVTLPTASPGWLCSVDLDAAKNVWVRNDDMKIELSGQLILKRDYEGLYFRGDLNVLRGSYTLYNNKFRIIDGSLNFSAAEVLRPEVYINAYTPHRIEGEQERRIYLTLTWPHDQVEPTLQLSYDDPGYYETDIWRMLGGNDIAGGLAANTLEKLLDQQMSGLTIDVDRRSTSRLGDTGDPERELIIGVGKYLWEDVYLRYRQGLTFETEREFEVEYRLSNMILIRSQIIRHTVRRTFGNVRQTADEYNLDVKLRFEY